jgi:hypothetical protein
MTQYIRNDVLLQNEPEHESEPELELEAKDKAEDQSFSIDDNAILEALEMMPFVSIRQITKMVFIHPTTAFRRLTICRCNAEAIALGSAQTLGFSKTGSGHHVKGVIEAT